MDSKNLQQLHIDLDRFMNQTSNAVNEFHQRINALSREQEQAERLEKEKLQETAQPAQEGILIDYTTFCGIINALSCAITAGDANLIPLYERLVAGGEKQVNKPQPNKQQPAINQAAATKETDKPVEKPEANIDPKRLSKQHINEFLNALIDTTMSQITKDEQVYIKELSETLSPAERELISSPYGLNMFLNHFATAKKGKRNYR